MRIAPDAAWGGRRPRALVRPPEAGARRGVPNLPPDNVGGARALDDERLGVDLPPALRARLRFGPRIPDCATAN